MRISLKQKQKLYIKFLKSKNPEDEFIYKKLQKSFRKRKEEIQAKYLFEPIRKTQRKRKTTMADLEKNHRKS